VTRDRPRARPISDAANNGIPTGASRDPEPADGLFARRAGEQPTAKPTSRPSPASDNPVRLDRRAGPQAPEIAARIAKAATTDTRGPRRFGERAPDHLGVRAPCASVGGSVRPPSDHGPAEDGEAPVSGRVRPCASLSSGAPASWAGPSSRRPWRRAMRSRCSTGVGPGPSSSRRSRASGATGAPTCPRSPGGGGTRCSTPRATCTWHGCPRRPRPVSRRTTFISSLSVYADDGGRAGRDRTTATIDDPTVEEVNGETYGALKVLSEREVQRPRRLSPDPASWLHLRPYDNIDCMPHWPDGWSERRRPRTERRLPGAAHRRPRHRALRARDGRATRGWRVQPVRAAGTVSLRRPARRRRPDGGGLRSLHLGLTRVHARARPVRVGGGALVGPARRARASGSSSRALPPACGSVRSRRASGLLGGIDESRRVPAVGPGPRPEREGELRRLAGLAPR
jgi:hypothetical protein